MSLADEFIHLSNVGSEPWLVVRAAGDLNTTNEPSKGLGMRDLLEEQAARLERQIRSHTSGNFHWEIGAALNRLREATLGIVPAENRDHFGALIQELPINKDGPYTISPHQAQLVVDQLLSALRHIPGEKSAPPPERHLTRVLPDTGRIFLIHGHDMENLLRLQRLLATRFRLEPVILAEEPSMGRSLIEKFEAEAGSCSFAFALLTPDDFLGQKRDSDGQARPNVVFELGWFYGRLGRSRVCLLHRRGTSIPSDLQGIGRIEFAERVDERIADIESELTAANLYPGQ